MARVVQYRYHCTSENIFQVIISVIGSLGINISNICGVTTDGATAMVGKVKGAVSLIEKEMRNAGIERKLVRTHCLIHLEALCAKSLKMQEVMRVVIKIVNFARARGLYHRQFQHMLEEMDNQYGDLLYYCEVRWLSRGVMLQRVYQLRTELTNFLREKGMKVPELSNAKWMTYFAFLTNHLNMLNSKIQGMNQFINVLYEHIYAFEVKLQPWELQLKESNCIDFPTLRSNQPFDVSGRSGAN